jgi:hypothetical protein
MGGKDYRDVLSNENLIKILTHIPEASSYIRSDTKLMAKLNDNESLSTLLSDSINKKMLKNLTPDRLFEMFKYKELASQIIQDNSKHGLLSKVITYADKNNTLGALYLASEEIRPIIKGNQKLFSRMMVTGDEKQLIDLVVTDQDIANQYKLERLSLLMHKASHEQLIKLYCNRPMLRKIMLWEDLRTHNICDGYKLFENITANELNELRNLNDPLIQRKIKETPNLLQLLKKENREIDSIHKEEDKFQPLPSGYINQPITFPEMKSCFYSLYENDSQLEELFTHDDGSLALRMLLSSDPKDSQIKSFVLTKNFVQKAIAKATGEQLNQLANQGKNLTIIAKNQAWLTTLLVNATPQQLVGYFQQAHNNFLDNRLKPVMDAIRNDSTLREKIVSAADQEFLRSHYIDFRDEIIVNDQASRELQESLSALELHSFFQETDPSILIPALKFSDKRIKAHLLNLVLTTPGDQSLLTKDLLLQLQPDDLKFIFENSNALQEKIVNNFELTSRIFRASEASTQNNLPSGGLLSRIARLMRSVLNLEKSDHHSHNRIRANLIKRSETNSNVAFFLFQKDKDYRREILSDVMPYGKLEQFLLRLHSNQLEQLFKENNTIRKLILEDEYYGLKEKMDDNSVTMFINSHEIKIKSDQEGSKSSYSNLLTERIVDKAHTGSSLAAIFSESSDERHVKLGDSKRVAASSEFAGRVTESSSNASSLGQVFKEFRNESRANELFDKVESGQSSKNPFKVI